MGRRNHSRRRPQAPRKISGTRGRPAPAPPLETLIVPKGRCYAGNPKGKLKFTEEDAPRALRQAQAKRIRTGSKNMEERTYQCPTCGYWHLTSRKTYRGEIKS